MSKETNYAQALSIVALVTVLFNFGVDTMQTKAINAQTKVIDQHTKALELLNASNTEILDEVFPDRPKVVKEIK